MRAFIQTLLLALTTLSVVADAGEERNEWPFFVEQKSTDSSSATRSGGGPFWFSQPVATGAEERAVRAHGVRPFYVATTDPTGQTVAVYSLYPLFSYRAMGAGYRWSIFELINHYEVHDPDSAQLQRTFDVWPFYFSVDSGSSETSYHAVLPVYGQVKHRFGMDRLSWVLFPLYAKWEKNGVTTTTAPFPFIRVLQGQGNRGFEFWPIGGYRAKAGSYRRQFYLWPLIYDQEQQLWSEQPDVKYGFLPFYAHSRDAASHSETFLWPFFGYTDRTEPIEYHEADYFWPFLVQGRGENHYINRTGPFYTHSVVNGTDTTWFLWPLWRERSFVDGGLRHRQRQFLYFLYNDTEQRSANNPALPAAHRTNVWPFFTSWDNGAGRKQMQALSPLEVFFPSNNGMRLSYSAFFALYRYSQISPGRTEQSALWNLLTYRQAPASREFHFGPIFSKVKDDERERYALGNGLMALQRMDGGGWHFSFFDFKSRETHGVARASAP